MKDVTRDQAAQGDILLTPVPGKPAGLKPVGAENGLLILARGEATGHHHSVQASTGLLEIDEGGVMYLTVEELTEVQHQEHAPVPRAPGIYRVDHQHEQLFDHWARVSD